MPRCPHNASIQTSASSAKRPNRAQRRSGFTLLELIIVATLGTLVMVFITNASVWYSRSIKQMHVSAALDKELKLAAAAIAQDYGPAFSVRTTDGTDLQFDYDSDANSVAQWNSPDTVVKYVLTGGNLIRQDLSSGDQVPLAHNISTFTAEMVSGQLNVHVVAAYRSTEQDITVQLRDPT